MIESRMLVKEYWMRSLEHTPHVDLEYPYQRKRNFVAVEAVDIGCAVLGLDIDCFGLDPGIDCN